MEREIDQVVREEILGRALKAELARLGHRVQLSTYLRGGRTETILIVDGKIKRLDLLACAPESMDGWEPYIRNLALVCGA